MGSLAINTFELNTRPLPIVPNQFGKISTIINQYIKDKNMELAVEKITPKIFWKDKPIILRQIKKWNLKKLEIAKKNIIDAEIKMKTKLNNYNSIIIKNLLVRLYQIANSTF